MTAQKLKATKKKVLIIDDSALSTSFVKYILETQGCDVECSSNPLDGLQKLFKNEFDLIVLDWKMPDLSGGEFLEIAKPLLKHKTGESHKNTSVVIYSETDLQLLFLPKTLNLKVRNLISKRLSISLQSKKFKEILKEAR
jgi:CheY-like chemotaxis protein